MRLGRSQIQPIGLDVGVESVKLLQLEVKGDGRLAVTASARQSTPEEIRKNPQQHGAWAAASIERMLAQQPFVGRNVVAALPREVVHVKNLRVAATTDAELNAAVAKEGPGLFSFDVNEAQLQFLRAGQVRQGDQIQQEMIVLAAKKWDVNQYMEQLAASGVEVASVDTQVTGLFRAFERFVRRDDDLHDVQMLVDIGARQTQVLITRGREISFYKSVELGGLHLLDAVGRKLGITIEEAKALRQRLLEAGQTVDAGRADPVRRAVFDATRSVAEDLARELAMCLRYYSVAFRGRRPERARLVGGEAADSQLHSVFRSILSIPVEPAQPLFSVDVSRMRSSDRQGSMAQWALAMGLGLRFTDRYFAPGMGSRARRRPRRRL